MKKNQRLIIVAPAYNEEKDLPSWLMSLRRIKNIGRVIVVDDGSKDKTAAAAEKFRQKLPLEIISYRPNRGPGYAFRKGLLRAINAAGKDDLVATMECDNTSDLGILGKMVKKVNEGFGVCVASYYATGGGFADVSWWRIAVSEIGNLVIRFGCGIRGVKTFSSFYRVYSRASLKKLQKSTNGKLFIENGFACMVELLARLKRQGEKIAEVPMILVGSKRKGRSKMRIIPTAIGYFRVIMQYRR